MLHYLPLLLIKPNYGFFGRGRIRRKRALILERIRQMEKDFDVLTKPTMPISNKVKRVNTISVNFRDLIDHTKAFRELLHSMKAFGYTEVNGLVLQLGQMNLENERLVSQMNDRFKLEHLHLFITENRSVLSIARQKISSVQA